MNILVKYPTRQRPDLFLKTISKYIELANDNSRILYLVSYDQDDITMTSEVVKSALKLPANVIMKEGVSISKIDACNRDIDSVPSAMWDIVLLVSDDMECMVKGWDDVIRKDMQLQYNDTDGCLWYHDGSKQRVISTLSCMGKKYYERFGYLYHPIYKSFFCDNEYTDVAKSMGKIKFIDNVIIKHQHPQWGGAVKHDDLYERNNGPWKEDQNNYYQRKAKGFTE